MRVDHLRCEYLTDPLGIDEGSPRLSWLIEDPRRGAQQSAYRVLCSSSPEALAGERADMWDSGEVASDRTSQIEYAGRRLASRAPCHWRVRVRDDLGRWTDSPPARFEMGLLDPSDWSARWIGLERPAGTLPGQRPSVSLRREFAVRPDVRRARLYTTALGLFHAFVNDKRVSPDCLAPGWTDYRKRVPYRTYDVTALLREGANAIGLVLADGWYCGYVGFGGNRDFYGTEPLALLQLEVEYADGTHDVVATDGSWRGSFDGPVRSADLLMGETHDARQYVHGWAEPGFDDRAWQHVAVAEPECGRLVAHRAPPVRVSQEIAPAAVTRIGPGSVLADLGQNMVGWVRLRVRGAASGDEITIRHAEVLDPDGHLYTDNLRGAKATDRYIASGAGDEVFEPLFTLHGFRYVQVDGAPDDLDAGDLLGVVAHTDVAIAGHFECSEDLVNTLQSNIMWGLRGNFVEIPTDCPQRDERLGWMGDAQVIARTATDNMDVAAFLSKWTGDVLDAVTSRGAFPNVAPRVVVWGGGAPGWGDAGVIVPFEVYDAYGDRRILERAYPAMKRWVDFVRDQNPDLLWREGRSYDFGDWVSLVETPKEPLSTAYFAHSADLVARAAHALGNTADADGYGALFGAIRDAFVKAYVSGDGTIEGDTQTMYAVALRFGLLPDDVAPYAAARLAGDVERRGHATVGFLGIEHLLPALTDAGRADLAYMLLLREEFPSWGYQIRRGATTMWERWDSLTDHAGFQDVGMNSFNHYAFGAVGEWLYACVAGLDRDPGVPGWRRIVVRPRPGGRLTRAAARVGTPLGAAAVAWELGASGLRLEVTVPCGATAEVHVPATPDAVVTESGTSAESAEGVRLVTRTDSSADFEVTSGEYVFESEAAATR